MADTKDRPRSPKPLPRSALGEKHGLDPFKLFCAYHLGITEDDRYEFQNVHQVAKRFGVSSGIVKQVLQEWEMDPDRIVNSSFDMAGAQVDMMRVPEGMSRTAMAQELWDDFRSAPTGSRDWKRELEADARANEKTFGPSRASASARDASPRGRGRR